MEGDKNIKEFFASNIGKASPSFFEGIRRVREIKKIEKPPEEEIPVAAGIEAVVKKIESVPRGIETETHAPAEPEFGTGDIDLDSIFDSLKKMKKID